MVIMSVVAFDFLPPGDGIAGVCFFETDLLAAEGPFFWGVPSFLSADLDGVYLEIFSACFLTPWADSTDFLPALAALA